VIEARAVTVAVAMRGSARALVDDVSLQVRPGEVVAIIGPNGAGKSTLLRTLAGDLQPTGGSVWLAGQPLAGQDPRRLARLRAVMLQGSKVVFPFTVADVVLLGRGLEPGNASDLALVRRTLVQVGLPESFATRVYTTLSGGEQQRVDLARVLVQVRDASPEAPALLLLDEPTASLDLAHESQMLALLRTEAASGRLGVLVVLHDLTLAGWVGDRLALMADGRLIACGPPAEVLRAEVIQPAYGTDVTVIPHPQSGLPLVLPARLGQTTAPTAS
jgi:iron complex transport system ATP-binding protein